MQWARYDRVMIAWDGQLGPTFRADDSRPYHHFVVSRGRMGDGSDARVIGTTEAEAYIDNAVHRSRVYHYSVQGADDAAETTLTAVGPRFTVATPHSRPKDLIPPTVPGDLAASAAAAEQVWTELQPAGAVDRYWRTCVVDSDGSVLLAVASGGRLYLSANGGSSWAEMQPAGAADKDWSLCAMDSDGSVILAGVYYGRLYLSANGGASWAETGPSVGADKAWFLCVTDSDGSVLLAGINGGRIYLSANGGASWAETGPSVGADKGWRACACDADGSVILAGVGGSYPGRLYLSANGGASWAETGPSVGADKDWQSCAMDSDGSVLLAGVYGGRLYLSTSGGSSWAETRPAGDTDKWWCSCACSADGSVLLAGDFGNGRIYLSTNGGSSWEETGPSVGADRAWYGCGMDSDGSVLMAGVSSGRLYRNGGWVAGSGGWTWTPSSKADPTRLLAYLVYDSNQSQPKAAVWAWDAAGDPVTSWTEPTTGPRSYRIAAIDKDLNISSPSNIATAT